MSVSWNSAPLSDVASFRSGLWKGKKGPFTTAKVIRNTNIRKHGQLSLDDVAEIEVETKQLETRRLQSGDIVLERSGGGPKQAVGRAVCFELDGDDFSFSNFTSFIRVQDRSLLSYRFLHLVLNWWYETGVTEKIQSNSTGIRNLDFNAYKALEVPLPPLKEQQRIVAVLDEAFEGLARARAHAEANLQNARELFETTLDDAFTNLSGQIIQKKLDDLITISHGFAFKGTDFGTSNDPALPIVLTPGNYTEDACLEFSRKNTKRFTGAIPQKFLFEPGDLTVVMTDLSSKMKILGKPAFIQDKAILHNQRIGRIRFRSNILSARLLFHFLRTKSVQRSIHNSATGTMVRHTAPKRILDLQICFPVDPIEQQMLVALLDEVETKTIELRSLYEQVNRDLDDLRQSLLQKAFAGELT